MPGAANMPDNRRKTMQVDFDEKQREFTAYIRNPVANRPPADVSGQRMALYRELIFNNIRNFLGSNFPVIKTLLDDRQWHELVQDFFSKHVSKSPYFSEIPEEFIAFLQEERDNPADFPFLLELAHYEWVEMALSIAKEEPALNAGADCMTGLLVQPARLSPLAWPLAYQYPVHKISPAYLPGQPPDETTFLLVYRDQTDEVRFLEITHLAYRLLSLLEALQPVLIKDCISQLAKELNPLDQAAFFNAGETLARGLAERGVIVL